MTYQETKKLNKYVFNRPVGEAYQEIGGVAITLNALCIAYNINLSNASDNELDRAWKKI